MADTQEAICRLDVSFRTGGTYPSDRARYPYSCFHGLRRIGPPSAYASARGRLD